MDQILYWNEVATEADRTTHTTGAPTEAGVRGPAGTFPLGLWEMIGEKGLSRTFLGVHWLFDAFAVTEAGEMDLNRNLGGVRPGLDLANDLAAHRLHAANAAGSRPAQSEAPDPRTLAGW
ncbi:MAG TPA: hypothetical protein VHY21_10470 [Pseudonocardiaceae bacterium]|nr:hypothetical protein [Pseudonocardiaceae bacterium]